MGAANPRPITNYKVRQISTISLLGHVLLVDLLLKQSKLSGMVRFSESKTSHGLPLLSFKKVTSKDAGSLGKFVFILDGLFHIFPNCMDQTSYRKSWKVIPLTNLYPSEKTHVHSCTDFASTMLEQIQVGSCIELIERIIFRRGMLIVTCNPSNVRLKIVGVNEINCGHLCKQHLCYSRIVTIIEDATSNESSSGGKRQIVTLPNDKGHHVAASCCGWNHHQSCELSTSTTFILLTHRCRPLWHDNS